MVMPFLALTLLAGSAAAMSPPAPAPAQPEIWKLASDGQGCMVHAATGHGTSLSIAAAPGEDALLFVVQNKELGALEDGGEYPIDVEFDDLGEWQIQALAQNELDSDGPGVIFAVRPGRDDGRHFIREFAGASGMHIGRQGSPLDTISLAGGKGAMSSLANCLSEAWSGDGKHQGQGGPLEDLEGDDRIEI